MQQYYRNQIQPVVHDTGRALKAGGKIVADVGGTAVDAAGNVLYHVTTCVDAPATAWTVRSALGYTWGAIRGLLRRG